jgi:hypothetical protein
MRRGVIPHVKLRAYHPVSDPYEVTEELRLSPSRVVFAGSPSHIPELGPVPENGWFLDLAGGPGDPVWRFVAEVLSDLAHRSEGLETLRMNGWALDLVVGPAAIVSLEDSPEEVRDAAKRAGLPLVRSLF